MILSAALRRAVKNEMRDQVVTQDDLARKIGTDQPHISRLLSGRHSGNVSTWEAILEALEIDVEP